MKRKQKKVVDLRSKYKNKVVTIEDYKRTVEQEEQYIYSGASSSNWLSIDEGLNKFRLFPNHNGGSFLKMRKRHVIRFVDDEGENKYFFHYNMKKHGGFDKDVVEEYLKFILENYPEHRKLVTHWKTGVTPRIDWVAYALKLKKGGIREFGLLELKKTVRDAINKELLMEDDDEPITIDPFTDPDEGYPILVKYNSKPNKKKGEDYYIVSISKKPVSLLDEELEKFDKSTPLDELFGDDIFTKQDFEGIKEVLQTYDEENEIGVFEDEEWLKILEEIEQMVYEKYGENDDEDEEDEYVDEDFEDVDDEEIDDEDVDEEIDEEDDEDEYIDEETGEVLTREEVARKRIEEIKKRLRNRKK